MGSHPTRRPPQARLTEPDHAGSPVLAQLRDELADINYGRLAGPSQLLMHPSYDLDALRSFHQFCPGRWIGDAASLQPQDRREVREIILEAMGEFVEQQALLLL